MTTWQLAGVKPARSGLNGKYMLCMARIGVKDMSLVCRAFTGAKCIYQVSRACTWCEGHGDCATTHKLPCILSGLGPPQQ